MLGICDNAVMERTSSEHRNLLYLYPPNVTSHGAADEIDGIEIIQVEVHYNSEGRDVQTVLRVSLFFIAHSSFFSLFFAHFLVTLKMLC